MDEKGLRIGTCWTTIVAIILAILKLCKLTTLSWLVIIGIWLSPLILLALVIFLTVVLAFCVKVFKSKNKSINNGKSEE